MTNSKKLVYAISSISILLLASSVYAKKDEIKKTADVTGDIRPIQYQIVESQRESADGSLSIGKYYRLSLDGGKTYGEL